MNSSSQFTDEVRNKLRQDHNIFRIVMDLMSPSILEPLQLESVQAVVHMSLFELAFTPSHHHMQGLKHFFSGVILGGMEETGYQLAPALLDHCFQQRDSA